jgi:signal transduction histidine kinase
MTAASRARAASSWRSWASSLSGRITLIVLVALLVVQSIQVGFFIYDRTLGRSVLVAENIAARVVSVVELYETAGRAERRMLLRAVSARFFGVAVRTSPPQMEPQAPDRLAQELRPRLGKLGEREISIWTGAGEHGPVALISLPVDGGWLTFAATAAPPDPNDPLRVAAWVLVTVAVVVLVLLAAHMTARPLSRFANAADRFGRDVNAPSLPEGGSPEVQRATRAFNRMQERLRRYVDDRMMMMAAISHDLRTVLTRLKLRAEFINDEEQREKADADLDEMQAMLESSLTFARDETVSEPRARVDLSALLQSVCDARADSGNDVTLDASDRLEIEGRPVALRRAFANLVENAVRYGGTAEVLLTREDGDVVLTVADRGPGIAPELHERVFVPFYRVEGSRSRETGGMGLGLSTARTTVRGHGGDVTLRDREGGGLVVRVVLPAKA